MERSAPHNPPCRVVLLGMMGTGKTTLGRTLAARIGWQYHDNDELLRAATGATARELLAEDRQALRNAEARALIAGLELPAPAIVGAAAGAVLDPDLRSLLARSALVVWLRAAPRILAVRAAAGTHRPWLEGDALAWLQQTAEERSPLYREVADHTLDTSRSSPDELATELVAWLESTHCARWLARPLHEPG
jgi:shikimate kinase